MPDDQRNGDESEARANSGRENNVLKGSVRGMEWQAVIGPRQVSLKVGGKEVHVVRDEIGSFVTHVMNGRWRDIGELASAIIRYHPDYSPLARRRPMV
jgi:hypothetical protein